MKIATLAQAPVFGGRVRSVDDSAARAVRGVRQIVRLEDAVESEEIFSTLMGEDVESRRKFIEENALDVKNLDI